jgi:hypothetical protein
MKIMAAYHSEEVILDDEDFEKVSKFNWFIDVRGYVVSSWRLNGKGGTYYLHRMVTSAPTGLEVDHINHNKLDNRKENLRVCTRSQNARNTHKHVGNTSGYKGVSIDNSRNRWQVHIKVGKKRINLGGFDDVIVAAKVYDDAARKYFGEFAHLNFPN